MTKSLLLIFLFIIQGYEVTSSVLDVSIRVSYTPPSDFDRPAPYYRAASPLSLTCEASGVTGAFYGWTSNCTGNCFILGQSTQTVSTSYLESTDSGLHMCTVYGINGDTGSASVAVNVVGAGIYVSSGHNALPNNGMIVTSGRVSDFRCISGSSRSNVGHLFDINDVDITLSNTDPFFIFRNNPGMVNIRSVRNLRSNEQGIYTCRIPDETGTTVAVNFGLYLNAGAVTITVSKMESSAVGDGTYTITCTSTGSPPTTVSWMRNEVIMTNSASDGKYISSQKVIDRPTSTYDNVLTIKGSFADAVGDYTCNMSNALGETNAVKTINALEVTGYENPIIVGLSGTLQCSTILNITTIKWYKTGIDTSLESSSSSSVELVLTPNSEALDGTSYTCQAVTVSGEVYSETVTIQVKELNNVVTIFSPPGTMLAGNMYTLTCTAFADITPQVRWTDPNDNSVSEGEGIILHGPVVSGNKTTYSLTFSYLRTSQAGTYSCLSIIDTPISIQSDTTAVTVKIPPPTMNIVTHPNNTQLFTTEQLNITCYTLLHPAVDTAVGVANTWSGPTGVMSSNGYVTVVGVAGTNLEFNSSLHFSSLRSSDSGSYSCFSTVSLVSSYIVSSDRISATIVITASLKTTILIDYTPPDQYPDYAPPNYRAASSVTLRCTTEGASGSVTYRWSSTCSSCFASNSYSSSITNSFLRSRDNGVHTCTTTDSNGNTGSGSTQMNIVGAGIYVSSSHNYAGRQANQPNNTYLSVYHNSLYYTGHYSYTRFALYCCSGSSSSNIGSFTDPYYGNAYTSNLNDIRIERYSSTSTYAGCIQMNGYRNYYSSLSYNSGVYTCNIPDSTGETQIVQFALYNYNTRSTPSIYSFQHTQSSNSVLALSCETRTVPPTEITWQRNGLNLTIDGSTVQMTQRVTHRRYSYFMNTISITENPDNVIGNYTVIVGNAFGHSTSSNITVQGIRMSASDSIGTVGSTITFSCTSDLYPVRIEWYRDSTLLSQTNEMSGNVTLDVISTDDEGSVYTCNAIGHRGSQERNMTLNVRVPDNWATVEITNLTNGDALHNHNYTLVCTVLAIEGMNIAPKVNWYHTNGSTVESGGRRRVSTTETVGTVTTLSLTFSPVLHTDGGEYTCRAQVTVPWMTTQPPLKEDSVDMVVTTQAKFQLRMGPLTHCSTWEISKAIDLEKSIKKDVELAIRKRCDCDFHSSAIYSGEFSCQTTSTEVIYRAIINGSSELLRASELTTFMEDWMKNEGTLLYNKIRLRLAQVCSLLLESFNELECSGDGDSSQSLEADVRSDKEKTGGLLFDSSTCYRIQSCGDGQDKVDTNFEDNGSTETGKQ